MADMNNTTKNNDWPELMTFEEIQEVASVKRLESIMIKTKLLEKL